MRRAWPLLVLAAVIGLPLAWAATKAGDDRPPGDPHRFRLGRDDARFVAVLRAAEAASAGVGRAELVAEGRRLFRSTALAKRGESCQSCHPSGGANPDLGTVEHPVAEGDFKGRRDPPTLLGVARTGPYGWTGEVPTLREMVAGTIVSHFVEGATQDAAVTGRQAEAIVAYLGTLDPPRTAFDLGTLSPAALRGQELFQGKAACVGCHSGALFTDNGLHDLLVPKVPQDATDPGSRARPGAFNTPQLRDVRNSAPYMHNGAFATLRAVVDFYNTRSSVAPLRLTQAEIEDLLAYLESL